MTDQRTYKAPRINLQDFARQVASFHQGEGYEVQVVEAQDGIVIQSRGKGFIKQSAIALTVTATRQGENLLVQTGHAKWGENIATGVVAAIFFLPLLALPAYTSVKQKQLIDGTWELVERYMVSIGGTPSLASVMPAMQPAPAAPVPEPVPQPVPQAAGAVCPNCGSPVQADARFCDNCGKPLARVCVSCGATLRQGARFCDQCGTPVG